MEFAHFAHIWGKDGMSPHQRYEQLWRELELCDALGFDYGFCVEHHFCPEESWMSSPNLFSVAAAQRTRRLRVGPMGVIVPLYHPLRLVEEIAIADQMLGGRMELGLVPGINAKFFTPFGIDFEQRKNPTMEFVDYMRAAYGPQPFHYEGEDFHTDSARLSVMPVQQPHPPLWMMSRDPETLEFCARNGVNTGYFLVFPRDEAAPRMRKYLDLWAAAGWERKPKIAYSTVVYVDETDEKALETALFGASRAYEGFLGPAKPGETFEDRALRHAELFLKRSESGAATIMANLFDADYLMEHELMFIGSPETVTAQLKDAATKGVFNTFMGEFNFHNLAEEDLMRSIRLFGEKVIPALRDYEPF